MVLEPIQEVRLTSGSQWGVSECVAKVECYCEKVRKCTITVMEEGA